MQSSDTPLLAAEATHLHGLLDFATNHHLLLHVFLLKQCQSTIDAAATIRAGNEAFCW